MNRFLYAKSLLMLVFTFCCGLELTRGQDIQSDSQNGASPIANSQEAQQSDSKVPVKPTKPKKKRADKFKPDKFLSYKKVEKGELRLHVFEPEGHQATDQAPAIVFFFGGGWNGGTPRHFYQQAKFFAGHGFVAMSAEYRVKKTHGTSPFQCVEDGKSAVRWIRSHAKELGIDPERIVASGGSAGGHVAACTGVIEGHENEEEDLTVSSIPNAMILFNPVLDTTEKGYGVEKVGQARKTEISPNHQVRAGIVPTLLVHGTADKTVPFENAETFARLMKEAGNQCRLESYEGKDHGFFNSKFFRPKTKDTSDYEQTIKQSLEFLTALGITAKDDAPAVTGKP